ncbi:hypothetical protein SteCoe_29075 [Stentor coeruleus]|uniref:Uncharacterized protein n=1 Tax=Stentor coeruleus TaxID=5963 RepID=A0A1R2B6T9_9CILI|nr:hypothetical protein SteCoe_29075 [Stentor coeruleus]
MQTPELRDYLQKSRQERRNLVELAEEIIKPTHTPNALSLPMHLDSEFPVFSPKRLMDFKEDVNKNLKQLFHPGKVKKKQIPILNSLSKEANYKKIYMASSTQNSKKQSNTRISSVNSGKKPIISLLPKSRYKETLLIPLFSNLKK